MLERDQKEDPKEGGKVTLRRKQEVCRSTEHKIARSGGHLLDAWKVDDDDD